KLGVTRVLTSGQEPSVDYGADVVKQMAEYAAGRIEILPGAGLTIKNAGRFVEKTGVTQVHVALTKTMSDTSTLGNAAIYYGGALYPPEDRFNMADADKIKEFIGALRG
ncbi:MAG: copper homeostasis protein CutC, partial [Clostridiales bacterium]|nr:copper homeostasis protein CutC [Clostridiales bacterium]